MKKLFCLILGLAVLASGCSFNLTGQDTDLPVVGSAENLRDLLKNQQNNYFKAAAEPAAEADGAMLDSSTRSHSSTNVQVEGIDEADVVKTDGTYIYQIAGNKVLITRAWPASSLKIAHELELEGFSPSTLYLDDDRLVVIGMQAEKMEADANNDDAARHMIMPILWQNTRVLVYDISDMNNITLSRDIAIDGYNATSRKKGDYIYLVNSRYVGWLMDGEEPVRPWYKDSAAGDEKTEIDFDDIRYFPDVALDDYVIFAALDLKGGKLEVDTYLGWAQHMYMSHENLFLAMTDWTDTTVFKFDVDGLNLNYVGSGTVAGTPLNQFSMDEHNGYFRIATTDYSDWENTNNALYVLDGSMKVVGQIKDIAPGERIYSARFMGDKGYLVTFETVDPLFVIDLSNPRDPKILGELKIPGFSNYLHPLDDNHLLGIGQDTRVQSYEGREFVTTKGIKLAIFDVSDVNNPREKHVELIGSSGSWSEALYDHKAVFYHDGVLAFSASVTEETNSHDWNYSLAFSGALFYDVDLERGFVQKGRVSHKIEENEDNYGYYNYDVRRIVQIEDVYYTISDLMVMAHNKDNFKKLGELKLPVSVPDHPVDIWR